MAKMKQIQLQMKKIISNLIVCLFTALAFASSRLLNNNYCNFSLIICVYPRTVFAAPHREAKNIKSAHFQGCWLASSLRRIETRAHT